MNSQIIVVDDFYDIPFHYHKSFDDGECLITEETIGKISQILNHPIQVTAASNEVGTTPGVLAHLECDWIGLIYLTLPLQAFGELGTKFYSHIETGLETFPTREELIKYNINEMNLQEYFPLTLNCGRSILVLRQDTIGWFYSKVIDGIHTL